LQPAQIVSLEQLRDKRYGIILCYPRCDSKETTRRVRELKRLGVEALEFIGEKTAFNVSVLGKGCVGIVVRALLDKKRVALKIRRVDADRLGMQHEAEMLKTANKIEVGPKLIGVSENFLLMEFVEGILLPEWIEKLKGKGTRNRIRQVLWDVLEQCWRLDEIGLDHGELSRAPKHIIIGRDNKAVIVDFETASLQRRVSNVTSICQYFFIGSQTAKIILRKLGKINQETLRTNLKNYKQNRTRENFNKILHVCGLLVAVDCSPS
jgi:putative serine/threonine protein kinase